MKDIIINVLKEIIETKSSDINEKTVIKEIENFDSLKFVMFISELEESYKIDLPLEKALEAKTVGDLIAAAEGK